MTTEPTPETVVTTPSRRAGLRDEIAAAVWERQNPGRRWVDCEYRWRADAEEDADAVLSVLYREWPWLRAEAEETVVVPPADRAALTARIAAKKAEPAFQELAALLTPPTDEDGLRKEIRRVLAAVDGFDIEQLEPHDYVDHSDAVLAVLPALALTGPDDTDLTEADIDQLMAAGVPVQIVTAPPTPCRTTQHCAYHGWCRRCAPEFATIMSAVNKALIDRQSRMA